MPVCTRTVLRTATHNGNAPAGLGLPGASPTEGRGGVSPQAPSLDCRKKAARSKTSSNPQPLSSLLYVHSTINGRPWHPPFPHVVMTSEGRQTNLCFIRNNVAVEGGAYYKANEPEHCSSTRSKKWLRFQVLRISMVSLRFTCSDKCADNFPSSCRHAKLTNEL
ncbi:hypothetical protein L209DRAFT_34271 [Thermothelomyces heterothallicus CBS 203.75]